VPTTFAGMAKNAASVHRWSRIDEGRSSGFSIGGMVAQQITLDRPDLIRKLILVGTAPRNMTREMARAHITPETAASLARPTTHRKLVAESLLY